MKKNIAVIFGGASSEHEISLASANAVINHIDKEEFNPVLVGITREGDWYLFTGDTDKIDNGTWQLSDCVPAEIALSRSVSGLRVFHKDREEYIKLDGVFPVLHGKNGEDGSVQGLCEMAGIPVIGCSILSSAIGMNKDISHKLAENAGIKIPKSVVISSPDKAKEAAGTIGYPLFVKPLRAGSSFGISKVTVPEVLESAVIGAFGYDDNVIIEEYIDGVEIGCAIMGNDELTVGVPDEIEIKTPFFDFTEKYNLLTSKIHLPARISPEKEKEIKETAVRIYRALNCRCFARVDMFLTKSGEIVFNEVNTIPGFTAHSRFPAMMQAAGYSFKNLIKNIINIALEG